MPQAICDVISSIGIGIGAAAADSIGYRAPARYRSNPIQYVFSVQPVSVHSMSISVQSLSVHTKYRYSPLWYINVNFGTSIFGTKVCRF